MATSLRFAFLFLPGILAGLLSCKREPSCPLPSPFVQVRFTAPTSQPLTELTILDSQSPNYPIQRNFILARDRQEIVLLPLNLNARQTRYTFSLRNRVDTLVVNYELSTAYAGRECGYYLVARRPTGRPMAQSTVGVVETVAQGEPAFADTTYGRFFPDGIQLKIRIRL